MLRLIVTLFGFWEYNLKSWRDDELYSPFPFIRYIVCLRQDFGEGLAGKAVYCNKPLIAISW